MTDEAFYNIMDHNRQKHNITVQRFCDDVGMRKKDYEYYMKGIKTMHPSMVVEVIKYFGLDEF